jgi:uncharacterized protein DUF3108
MARAACVLLYLISAYALALPERFTADYVISTLGLEIGETRRTLQRASEERFVFESVTRPRGILALILKDHLTERSLDSVRGGVVRPLEYLYERSGGEKTKLIKIVFDWNDRIARSTSGKQEWNVALPEGTQDKLGFQLALMQDLQGGKTSFTYPIADKDKVNTYRALVVGKEDIATPMGVFQTIKLKQLRESSERDLALWCAPSLAYLPVQIEYREKDGRVYRSTLRALEGLTQGR